MPQYQNDTGAAVVITNLAGESISVAPGGTVTTWEISSTLTELDPAPYWCPAVATNKPYGTGDLAAISLQSDCHAVEIWNDSPATVTIKLRDASADALIIAPYSMRRIGGPYGLALASVADSLLINVSEAITEGQLIVTELHAGEVE